MLKDKIHIIDKDRSYIDSRDILEEFNSGELKFKLPFYEDHAWYNDQFKIYFKDAVEGSIEMEPDMLKHHADFYTTRNIFGKKFDPIYPIINLFEIKPHFEDQMSGEVGRPFLNLETNTIHVYSLHDYLDKKYTELTTHPQVFSNRTETMEFDVPSGEMVFGYYSTYLLESAEIRTNKELDYFDSDRTRKNFYEHCTALGFAMWYRGGFELWQKKKSKDQRIMFLHELCGVGPTWKKVSSIEHDKCTCFVDLQTFLKVAKEMGSTFEMSDYKNHRITEENVRKEAKEKSDFKALDILQVTPGRYRVSIMKDYEKVYRRGTKEEDKPDTDYDYEIAGWLELVKAF